MKLLVGRRLTPVLIPWMAAAMLLVSGWMAGGCQPRQSEPPRASRQSSAQTQDRFDQAFELLDGGFEIGSDEAYLRASFFVNEWLTQQSVNPDQWSREPLLDRLPSDARNLPELAELSQLEVDTSDMRYLEFVMLVRQLGDWVVQQPTPPVLQEWLSQSPLGDAERVELARAERLFDWTIRNIQLENIPLPANAGPGTAPQRWAGYWLLPREVLMYGRGDSWQRAGIFIELCRQQNLQAVLLAVAADSAAYDPTPWLPAVHIGDQLYLFDTTLGVPAATADGRGIATLSQVVQNPPLLDLLSVADLFPYAVGAEQLGRLYALVAASPEALSARMKLIEQRLTGDRRLILHASVSEQAARLGSQPHIQRVLPWAQALRTNEEHRSIERLLRREPQRAFEMIQTLNSLPLQTDNPLVQGRKLHLRGRFDNAVDGALGAKAKYMEIRIPQAKLDRIPTDIDTQRELGLARAPGERDEDWQQRVASMTVYFKQALFHSSFWLALIQYEQGNYPSAESWLVKRNLETTPDGPWTPLARYNLARCLEGQGRVDEARSIYLTEQGPQRHGNLIRARLLQMAASSESSAP